LYIIPYPEFRSTLTELHNRVLDALPEDDPDMWKRVEAMQKHSMYNRTAATKE
jgi:hypothetical protein